MDLISAFKSEVLRPIVTLVIPGATSIAPWVLVVSYYIPKVAQFWSNHPSAFVAIIVVCVLSAGLILEDIGAEIELCFWNRIKDEIKAGDSNTVQWEKYLKLQMKDEVVGERYLQTVVMRLKFELSMPPALLSFAIGLLVVGWLYDTGSRMTVVMSSVIVVVIGVYLLWEVFRSVKLLAHTRRLIVKSVEEHPITPAPVTPTPAGNP